MTQTRSHWFLALCFSCMACAPAPSNPVASASDTAGTPQAALPCEGESIGYNLDGQAVGWSSISLDERGQQIRVREWQSAARQNLRSDYVVVYSGDRPMKLAEDIDGDGAFEQLGLYTYADHAQPTSFTLRVFGDYDWFGTGVAWRDEYVYDLEDRKVESRRDFGGDGSLDSRSLYTWSGDRLISRLDFGIDPNEPRALVTWQYANDGPDHVETYDGGANGTVELTTTRAFDAWGYLAYERVEAVQVGTAAMSTFVNREDGQRISSVVEEFGYVAATSYIYDERGLLIDKLRDSDTDMDGTLDSSSHNTYVWRCSG